MDTHVLAVEQPNGAVLLVINGKPSLTFDDVDTMERFANKLLDLAFDLRR